MLICIVNILLSEEGNGKLPHSSVCTGYLKVSRVIAWFTAIEDSTNIWDYDYTNPFIYKGDCYFTVIAHQTNHVLVFTAVSS